MCWYSVYCWLTLCPLLDWLGGFYREDARLWRVWSAAQVAWFRLHNNRLANWVEGRCNHFDQADATWTDTSAAQVFYTSTNATNSEFHVTWTGVG